MRFINSLVAAVVALIVVLFAVSNRQPIVIEVWPFPFRIEASLYAVILVAILLGFVAGAIAAWMGGAEKRSALRAARKRTRELEQSVARLKDDVASARAKTELSSTTKP